MSGVREGNARGPVDWAEVRRRVQAAAAASSGEGSLTPERARAILSERARALAQPLSSPGSEEGVEVVVFTLGGETYAVESRYVMEAFRTGDITPLPGVVAPVAGVTAWRGELLVILDLRGGGPSPLAAGAERVLVVGEERPAFGLLAEEVKELRRIPPGELHLAPEGVDRPGSRMRGMTTDAVLVLDAGELIRTHR